MPVLRVQAGLAGARDRGTSGRSSHFQELSERDGSGDSGEDHRFVPQGSRLEWCEALEPSLAGRDLAGAQQSS